MSRLITIRNNTIIDFFNQNIIGFDLNSRIHEPNAGIFENELNLKIDSKIDTDIMFIYEPKVEKANSDSKTILQYIFTYKLLKYDDLSNKLVLVDFQSKLA